MTLADVTAVGTHSHAWAQVRGWVGANLPGATYVPTLSTASSAMGLAAGEQNYQAAVCAPIAADLAGLTVLAEDIGDVRTAVTRFVLVSRPGELPAPTGPTRRRSCSTSVTTTVVGCSSCSSSSPREGST